MSADVVVVGAGIAGLACAQALSQAGRRPLVLEKARGVGGRCATRRVRGQAVDHGVVFFHGSDPEFHAVVRGAISASSIERWPARVEGRGQPCQPDAFAEGEWRLASADGVSALPKSLAEGLDVRLGARVDRLEPTPGGFEVFVDGVATVRARDAVLALPLEQTCELLGSLAATSREAASARALLAMTGSLPCLTVLAGYPAEAPMPEWDVLYPESSDSIQLVAHDSSKRRQPAFGALVFQARPCWSRQHLDEPVDRWREAMLGEAGRLIGAWAAAPIWSDVQRWRYARADRGNEFSVPLLLRWPAGVRLGLAGEAFAPGGGIQAAWSSARRLARRLLDEE